MGMCQNFSEKRPLINTYGRARGRNGSYTTNWQITGRELMTPDEVRKLDNQYALLFIRGECPVEDLKYDITKHPNVRFTTDGCALPRPDALYWHCCFCSGR